MTNTFTDEEVTRILAVKTKLVERLVENFLPTAKKVKCEYSFFVSGGCIGSWLRGEEPKDIDVWFFDEKIAAPLIRLYKEDESYKNEVAVMNEKYRDIPGHPAGGPCITENAITLRNKIQLITKHYGEPDKVRETFDFIHCKPYFDSRDRKLHISYEQYNLNMNKELRVNNALTVTTWREQKFKERGWEYGDKAWP